MSIHSEISEAAIGSRSLSDFIANPNSPHVWYYVKGWFADGKSHENLLQLLDGWIVPHEEGNEMAGDDYHYVMFNFTENKVEHWFCWGAEPNFLLVDERI